MTPPPETKPNRGGSIEIRSEYIEVEVVSLVGDIWAAVALIIFGSMLGFVWGLGYSYGDMEVLAERKIAATECKARIVGNVSITSNAGNPVQLQEVSVHAETGPALYIGEER